MASINLSGFSKSSDAPSQKLPAGAYICKIIKADVENSERGEKIKLFIDIAQGDFTDYFKNIYLKRNSWPFNATFTRYIKKDGLYPDSFKNLIKCIEQSNPEVILMNKNETELPLERLTGLLCGFSFGEEEYKDSMNIIRTACKVKFPHSVKSVRDGKIKPLPLKKLEPDNIPPEPDIDEQDLPFL